MGPSMRDAKMVKASHEPWMRAVAVAAVYGAGMYIDTERNSKRRECRTWRLACATVPVSVGMDAGVEAAGDEGPGHERVPGTEVDVGTGGCGAGTRAFATATVVIRRCARLRSVLRWLTRRLEVLPRAVGRGAVVVVGGTQSRYTSIVANECWGSGLSALRAASLESRVAEVPYGAYLQVPSVLRERIEYRG